MIYDGLTHVGNDILFVKKSLFTVNILVVESYCVNYFYHLVFYKFISIELICDIVIGLLNH